MSETTWVQFHPEERHEDVSGILDRPRAARWLYVLGHGAGAGMRHPFMEAIATELNHRDIATFRYQFPYMERGGRLDPQNVLLATVRAAVAAAHEAAGDLPMIAGGKSMGGRMTSLAAAEQPLDGVRGLAFVGFPLHLAGKPQTSRAAHLEHVKIPMLFLQGTRDTLAELDLMTPVVGKLSNATLHVVDGADHAFSVLKRSGTTNQQVLEDLALTVADWTWSLGKTG